MRCYSRVMRQDFRVLYELRGGVRVMVYEASMLTSCEVMNNELRVTRVLKVRVMGYAFRVLRHELGVFDL